MQLNKLGKILKIILIIGFFIYIPIMIYIPFLLRYSTNRINGMIMIYPNGILMIGIIYEFMKIFQVLEENHSFSYEAVHILRTTGIISFIISIIWLFDLIFMLLIIKNTYINYILVLVFLCLLFFGVSVALYIISELLKQATEYKEENDLTI